MFGTGTSSRKPGKFQTAFAFHVKMEKISSFEERSFNYFFAVPEVTEAFSEMDVGKFREKYGFERPSSDVGAGLLITCRSGRRVGLAVTELEKLGFKGLR